EAISLTWHASAVEIAWAGFARLAMTMVRREGSPKRRAPEDVVLRGSFLNRGQNSGRCRGLAFFVGLPNSETSQQNCAGEQEGSAHRQEIQFQGKVHERPPLWLAIGEIKQNRPRPETNKYFAVHVIRAAVANKTLKFREELTSPQARHGHP